MILHTLQSVVYTAYTTRCSDRHCSVYFIISSAFCTMQPAYCIVFIAQCILYTAYYPFCFEPCTMHTEVHRIHCTPTIAHKAKADNLNTNRCNAYIVRVDTKTYFVWNYTNYALSSVCSTYYAQWKGVNAESRVSRIDGCGGFDFDGVYKNLWKLISFF